MALGLAKGHNLVTSPITFVASANCAQYLGAKTIFVDIENKVIAYVQYDLRNC